MCSARPDTPLVSVLTPSFNQAAWLGDNIASVACQTYPNVEHIVMDGGSTDGTLELLSAAGDSVRWRSEPDEGQADAVNKAFAMSLGDIIGWINSDDAYFDCHVIEDVVAFFRRHPDVDVAYGHCLQTTGDGGAIQILWVPPFDHELLKTTNVIAQPAVFMRKRVLTKPLLDVTYHFAMDYELWLRLAAGGARFARSSQLVAIDRRQPERKSIHLLDVHAEDMGRLACTYGIHLSGSHERRRTTFYLKQRLMGALLVPKVHGPFAFTTPAHPRAGLLRRQLLQRKSTWPEEYR